MPNIRMSRINSEIQKHVAQIINNLEHPDIKGSLVCVQKVDTTPDLLACTIWVSSLAGDKQKTVAALNNSRGFIRRELASKLFLKTLPELTFKLDTTDDYAKHMDELFKNIEDKHE